MNADTKQKAVNIIARLADYLGNDADADTAKALATDLQNLAAMIDPTRTTTAPPSATFHLDAKEAAIIRLLDELKAAQYIAQDTAPNAFIYACTAHGNINEAAQIQWLGTARALAYFVTTFFGNSDGSRIWETTINCFLPYSLNPLTTKALANAVNKTLKDKDGTKAANVRRYFNNLHRDFKQWNKEPRAKDAEATQEIKQRAEAVTEAAKLRLELAELMRKLSLMDLR